MQPVWYMNLMMYSHQNEHMQVGHCHMVEWFTKDTACDTWRLITTPQVLCTLWSYFGNFWVNPTLLQMYGTVSKDGKHKNMTKNREVQSTGVYIF